jgi:hypothetical protein
MLLAGDGDDVAQLGEGHGRMRIAQRA